MQRIFVKKTCIWGCAKGKVVRGAEPLLSLGSCPCNGINLLFSISIRPKIIQTWNHLSKPCAFIVAIKRISAFLLWFLWGPRIPRCSSLSQTHFLPSVCSLLYPLGRQTCIALCRHYNYFKITIINNLIIIITISLSRPRVLSSAWRDKCLGVAAVNYRSPPPSSRPAPTECITSKKNNKYR